MSDFWSEERITDYLDDRLSPADREMVEAHLQQNPRDRETLEEFQQMREALRGAQTYRLDDGFSQRVIQTIEQLPVATDPLAPLPVTSPVTTNSSRFTSNWRYTAGIVAALAATLLLGVFLIPRNQTSDPMARADKNDFASESSAGGVKDQDPGPDAGLVTDDQPAMDNAQIESSGEAEEKSSDDEKFKAMKESEQSGAAVKDGDMVKSEEGQSEPGEVASPAARARAPDTPAERDDAGRKQFAQGKSAGEDKEDEGDPRWAGGADVRTEEGSPERMKLESREALPIQVNGAELVVVTSSPGNRSIIESLDSQSNNYRRSPVDKTREKRSRIDRSRNRRGSDPEDSDEATNPPRERDNAGMGRGQVDPPLEQPSLTLEQPSLITAESMVFEIEATAEEFDEILKKVNAQRLTFTETDRDALLKTVRGALPSDAAVGSGRKSGKGRPGQSSKRGRSGGFDDGSRDSSERSKNNDEGPRIRRVKDLADWNRGADGAASDELADMESEARNLNPDQMGVDSDDQPIGDLAIGRRQKEQQKQKQKKSRPANVNEQHSGNAGQQGQQQSESGESFQSDDESQMADAQASGQEGLMLQQEIPQRRRYLLVINLVTDGPAASSEVAESELVEEGENVAPRPRSEDKK